MTIARREIIDEAEEGTYHCISRCVRRAFLCGFDKVTKKHFDHRKQWVEERLKQLSGIFAVDIGAKAIMENHLHLVLRNRPDLVKSWDDLEVARRWRALYPKRLNKEARELELELLSKNIEQIRILRARLSSISWFMKSVSEYLAKRANKEDGCKGRFWEGRFKCTALKDEAAILACLVYVDLNPIRAKKALTPEESQYTSIRERLIGWQARERLKEGGRKDALSRQRDLELSQKDRWLCPISNLGSSRGLLSISETQYLKLVDYSGRELVSGKRGAIPAELSPIMERLEINSHSWPRAVSEFGSLFSRASGQIQTLMAVASQAGKNWIKGYSASRLLFTGAG